MRKRLPAGTYLFILAVITGTAYFINLGYNDIWNPNEGFYADAVRHLLQNNNLLDFFFNNEYRFNKPPVTYWVIALSCRLFGLSEFSIRLPIVLLALGTCFFTGSISGMLFGKKTALWSGLVMAVSFQFLINTRYAAPEIPLTFFFTLTMYFFVRFIVYRKPFALWSAWISLGVTMLVKGYPYLIIITAIMASYAFFSTGRNFRNFVHELKQYRILTGIVISLLIGMSWPFYSWIKFGNDFLHVLDTETTYRAFRYQADWFRDLFFFPLVMLWGFLPYSLVFIPVAIASAARADYRRELLFPFVWVAVILMVFTIARFKLPTYFIQAHPAMAVVTGWYLGQSRFSFGFERWIKRLGIFLPGMVFIMAFLAAMSLLNTGRYYLLLLLLPASSLILSYRNSDKRWILGTFPLTALVALFLLFTASVLPSLEKVRPYKEIGAAIRSRSDGKNSYVFLENRFLHNLPYYSRQKTAAISSGALQKISVQVPYFLLAEEKDTMAVAQGSTLWKGIVYKKNSEAAFFPFLLSYYHYLHGDSSGFRKYRLLMVFPGKNILPQGYPERE